LDDALVSLEHLASIRIPAADATVFAAESSGKIRRGIGFTGSSDDTPLMCVAGRASPLLGPRTSDDVVF